MASEKTEPIRIRCCGSCDQWTLDVALSHEVGFTCGECWMFGQHRYVNAWCNAWEKKADDDD